MKTTGLEAKARCGEAAAKGKWKMIRLASALLAVAGALVVTGLGGMSNSGFVAHEWGTFTSLQGGDGQLLSWKPLQTSQLPRFVYDWQKPELGRQRSIQGQLFINKGGMITLQRMETPVVYFYADKEQTVDLSVWFPAGSITEWFPQAGEVGPSVVPPPQAAVSMDNVLHRCGAPKSMSVTSLFKNRDVKQSLIHWSDIKILPAGRQPDAAKLLPTDTSGSHYFAARDTDAAYLRLNSLSRTNPPFEYEKFLFYRGVGNFTTPLKATMKADDAIRLTNTGKEVLRHCFVLSVQNQAGHFAYVDELQAGEGKSVSLLPETADVPLDKLAVDLGRKMVESLTAEGLYSREAKAMANTWKDSWFAEEGVRVLYVLPRAWTDRTLPMKITPEPKALVRVMLGRAEVLTPGMEAHLAGLVRSAAKGDQAATEQVHEHLQKLGRFAEPALYRALALAQASPESYAKLVALLGGTTPNGTGPVRSAGAPVFE
jgi:hypothetical protein